MEYNNNCFYHVSEIMRDRLYFAIANTDGVLKNTSDTWFFNVDDELVYANFYYDFGPLNLSCVYKYCCKVNSFLHRLSHGKRLVHYTSLDPNKRTNAAFLMGCFGVIYLKYTPKDVFHLLSPNKGHYRPFVDASQCGTNFTISLLDCFSAMQRALTFGFYDFNDFNVDEYDMYSQQQHGDMNWVVPRKFLALVGPSDCPIPNIHSPGFYLDYFLANDVVTVIRLNNKVYDSQVFTAAGICHHELYFPDGSVPSRSIISKFLNIAERSKGAVAVHCKAGLGRTGTLISTYIMKYFNFDCREAIAWLRICRPGSVIGPQQACLQKYEQFLWDQGKAYRRKFYGDERKIPGYRYGVYSIEWKKYKRGGSKYSQKKPRMFEFPEAKYTLSTFSPQTKLVSSAYTHLSSTSLIKTASKLHNKFLKSSGTKVRVEKSAPSNGKARRKEEEGMVEITQGDRLNNIKAIRYVHSNLEKYSNELYVRKRATDLLREKKRIPISVFSSPYNLYK